MKKALLAFVMFFMMIGTSYGQSNVYVKQADNSTGLDVEIYIDGTTSSVGEVTGTNDGVFEIKGADNNIDIDIIGTGSVITGDFVNTSENSTEDDLIINLNGTDTDVDLSIGKTNAATNVRANIDVDGGNNDIFIDVGEISKTCTAGDMGIGDSDAADDYTTCTSASTVYEDVDDLNIIMDLDTSGHTIRLGDIATATAASETKLYFTVGDGNTVDVYKRGSAVHDTEIRLGAGSQTILVNQEGSGATDVKINSDGASSNINVFTSTVGNIDLESDGASADIDVIVQP